jgi:hypothetical protein
VNAYVRANQRLKAPYDDACTQQLARLAACMADLSMVPLDRPSYARELLIRKFDAPGRWWWGRERPTLLDLTVLSLLAGNGLEQRRPPSSGAARSISLDVAEVVRTERHAVRKARARLRTESKDTQSTYTRILDMTGTHEGERRMDVAERQQNSRRRPPARGDDASGGGAGR